MGYTTEQCINTLLAASGPQDFDEIKAECGRQVWGEPNTNFHILKVLNCMVKEGKIVCKGEFFALDAEELDE